MQEVDLLFHIQNRFTWKECSHIGSVPYSSWVVWQSMQELKLLNHLPKPCLLGRKPPLSSVLYSYWGLWQSMQGPELLVHIPTLILWRKPPLSSVLYFSWVVWQSLQEPELIVHIPTLFTLKEASTKLCTLFLLSSVTVQARTWAHCPYSNPVYFEGSLHKALYSIPPE